MELWHAPNQSPYATALVDGHHEHLLLRRFVRDVVAPRFLRQERSAASSQALTDATATLAGMAVYEGREHPVSLRVANHDEAIYLDLGTPDWSVVRIEKSGWHIEASSPVRFWRPPTLFLLPLPVSGDRVGPPSRVVAYSERGLGHARHLAGLRDANIRAVSRPLPGRRARHGQVDTREDQTPPGGPSLLQDLRGVPRDERDVMLGALAFHVLALDNLSGTPPWASDAFCRVATGGGFATRALYTDSDEMTIDVSRPILLTGIEQPASRGNLARPRPRRAPAGD